MAGAKSEQANLKSMRELLNISDHRAVLMQTITAICTPISPVQCFEAYNVLKPTNTFGCSPSKVNGSVQLNANIRHVCLRTKPTSRLETV